MQILICPGNFNCVVGDLMTELKDQLSIVYPRIIYTKHTIYIRPDIEIRFVPPFAQFVRGRHPDYFGQILLMWILTSSIVTESRN